MALSPGFLSGVGLFSQVAGSVFGASSNYYSAKNQKSSLQFQAQMAHINARVAEIGAQAELRKGRKEVAALTMKAGQLKSRQRAALAANNITLDEGSAAEMLESTDFMKDIDVATLQDNAVRSAWGYRTQAANLHSDAAMRTAAGGAISPSGALATSLLSSASPVATAWYNFQRSRSR